MEPWLAAATASFTLVAFAEDWPQWRGPGRKGISTEKVSVNWPETRPRIVWHASVGTGFSSISISQNRLFTMGNASNQDTVWCLGAAKGNLVWKHAYPSQLGPQYYQGGPGATPTLDENHVFTISKWGDVYCFKADSGAIVWHRDLRQDGLKPNRWGFAGSPLLWHDLVILSAGTAGTALDRKDGRIVWISGTNATGYASPTLFHSGSNEVVLIFAAKHLVAVDPATGHELWRYPWETSWDTNNTDPLVYGENVFISSFSRGCALLSLKDGQPLPVYQSNVLSNNLSPGILLGEYLYAFNGEAKQDTDFRCIHLPTGGLKWNCKDPAFGSLICADGKLIVLSEKGELLIVDASPSEFKPVARAKVLGGLCWTPSTLAHGLLYARNAQGELLCMDLRPGR